MRWFRQALGAANATALMVSGATFAPAGVPLPPARPAGLAPPASLPGTAPLPPADPRRTSATASPAPAQPVPVPPAQGPPAQGPPAQGPPAQAAPAAPAADETPAEPDAACSRVLANPHATIRRVEPIKGAAGCALPEPVRLDAVTREDGGRVSLEPAPVMRCAMAESVIDYVRIDLSAAAAKIGATLLKVATAAAYDCRGRNRIVGAKLSEHARGNALDIGALQLADGRVIAVGDPAIPAPLAEHWRNAACARFTTVLGPGSDPYHQNHIHVDLAERRSGYRMCQWVMQPGQERPGPGTPSPPSP